ncbi:riboflavin kinase [Liquorilactobacillus sicerae]
MVYWIAFLREQIKYANAEELVDQLKQDQIDSLHILNKSPKIENYF